MIFQDVKGLNHLKLTSKKLRSGKLQVKFQVKLDNRQNLYGYLTAEPETTLREVVGKIRNRITKGQEMHLFSIRKPNEDQEFFMIFKSKHSYVNCKQ
jgi:hypothetical protein